MLFALKELRPYDWWLVVSEHPWQERVLASKPRKTNGYYLLCGCPFDPITMTEHHDKACVVHPRTLARIKMNG